MLLRVDPAARWSWKHDGEWRIWLGWAAAAMLHGGLLAALICSKAVRLNPAPADPAAVSLLMVAAGKPAVANAVRPKPPGEPRVMPTTAPVKIANAQIAGKMAPAISSKLAPSRLPGQGHAESPPGKAVAARPAMQQDKDGFAAAVPVAGDVNQPPEYPQAAYDHGEQGDVLLSIHVLPNGAADSVSVTQSSGYDSLDQAAAAAVWKWRFQPSTLSGRPVPSVIPYWIHFRLQTGQRAD